MNSKAYLPVKQKQVSTLVFEQLRDAIFRGRLKAGERILPERELAVTMKVSRTSVRSAIAKLITLGYLENHQGKGTFVATRDSTDVSNPFQSIINPTISTVDELLEFRVGLGMHGVSLAAMRATPQDIKYLEDVLKTSGAEDWNPQTETESDIAFHMGIAYATHNMVYVDLTRRFYEYMFFRLKELHYLIYENQLKVQEIERQHQDILDGIRMHDPESAQKAMVNHIEQLREMLRVHSIE